VTSPFVRYAAQQSRFLQHGDARRGCDRSAVVTTAILQIVATAPAHQLRQQTEQYLRAEFADLERQATADWELG
jgi:hypothetical protein